MSPELLDPDQFGIKDGRPTKESDSYALGMVILEVLSGHAPFRQFRDVIVMRIVLEGKRPERPNGPEGVWFTDDLWRNLTLCWESQREIRPSIETILECLRRHSVTWKPPPLQEYEDVEMGEEDWDLTTVSDSSGMVPRFNPFFFALVKDFRADCVHDILLEMTPSDPQPPLTDPPEEDPPKGVTVMKALPTIPPSYSAERAGEITVYDESVPYITTPPIPDTPVEFISVELWVLAPRLSMRFELSLNAPTSLRLPRGVKPVRGLEKWRGEIEISHEMGKRPWGDEGLGFIGVHGTVRSDEPCRLAKTGDSLTVWAVPDEFVDGVSVQSARVLYGMR
jgi:serine/threonine protein kinase